MIYRFWTQTTHEQAEALVEIFERFTQSVSWYESEDEWIVEGYSLSLPNLDLYTPLFPSTLKYEEIEDQDWLKHVYDSFPARSIGPFYIFGSHIKTPPPSDLIPLEINAATAFGSGEHETTIGCLYALAQLKEEGYTFQKPLDIGCGSGILALAITKLWNVFVSASDNDPEALRVTQENACLNHCQIQTVLSEGFYALKASFDLITANILASPLIEMAFDLTQALDKKGIVILSGLLHWQKDEILKTYQSLGLTLISEKNLNNWITLILQKI